MNLYIRTHDDYRSGIDITVYDKEDLKSEYVSEDDSDDSNNVEPITDEKFNIKLDMDEDMLDIITINNTFHDTYAVYLIYGEGYHDSEKTKIIHIINQIDDTINILQHLYSDINGHQPFVQTGYTCSYKSEGYYPEALPEYFINTLIQDQIKKLHETLYSYCVAVIIKDQKLMDYLQINHH